MLQHISCLVSLVIFSNWAKGEDVVAPKCDVTAELGICLGSSEDLLIAPAKSYGQILRLTFDGVDPIDSSGHHNHAEGRGFPTVGYGGSGSGSLFRQSYISVPNSPSFASSEFSYTFFIYIMEDDMAISRYEQLYCPLLCKGGASEQSEIASPGLLINPSSGRLKVVQSTTATKSPAVEEFKSNSRLRKNQWYHIAVVRHLNVLKLFVNGVLDSSYITQGHTINTDQPLYIGSSPQAHSDCDVPVIFDEVKSYSYAVGRNQIQAEAAGTLGGIEPSYVEIGCLDCSKATAQQSCSEAYHLCNRVELYIGGYAVARTLSLTNSTDQVLFEDSVDGAQGLGLCCKDTM